MLQVYFRWATRDPDKIDAFLERLGSSLKAIPLLMERVNHDIISVIDTTVRLGDLSVSEDLLRVVYKTIESLIAEVSPDRGDIIDEFYVSTELQALEDILKAARTILSSCKFLDDTTEIQPRDRETLLMSMATIHTILKRCTVAKSVTIEDTSRELLVERILQVL